MAMSLQSLPPVNHSNFSDDPGYAPGVLLRPQDSTRANLYSPPTRTVAIIKTDALDQRLDIEPHILQAGFEIVRERQIEFDADPEALHDYFGDDAQFLVHGPVWVYVLERRRSVSVLLSLLPSLNNEVIGVKSEAHAEALISQLFASSPLPSSPGFHTVASEGEFDSGSIRSINSAVLEALQLGLEAPVESTHMLSPSPGSSEAHGPGFCSTPRSLTASNSSSGNTHFRARPLPKTHLVPHSVPRLTKSARLRQGITSDGSPITEHKTRMSTASTGRIPTPRKNKENEAAEKEREKERAKKIFSGVPGHKRVESINVASTAPPAIAPRLTKAAALRLGLERPSTPPGKKRLSLPATLPKAAGRSPSTTQNGLATSVNEADGEETETEAPEKKNTFEGVPGHKRRESFSVASTKPPAITPRLNKSATLRQEGRPPPSSFMFRGPTEPKTPGSGAHSRSSSVMSAYHDNGGQSSWSRPVSTVPPRSISRTSRGSAVMLNQSYSPQTMSSGAGAGPLSTSSTTSNESNEARHVASPTRKVRRPSSLQAPTIAPRANKSAMLRVQKQAADAAKPKSPWANASKR